MVISNILIIYIIIQIFYYYFAFQIQRILYKQQFLEQLDGIEAAVFDFDGTIADTLKAWERVDQKFFGKRNIQYNPKEYFDHIMGMSLRDTAQFTKEKYNLQESIQQILDEWSQIYEEILLNEVQLFPGTIQLFQLLKSMNIKIGIASACPRKLIQAILDNHNRQSAQTPISKDTQVYDQIDVNQYIDDIETCDEIGKNKPDPTVFNICIEKLNVKDKQKVIIFEDSVTGLKAANAANTKLVICHLSDDHNKEQRIQLSHYQVDTLLQIV